MRKMRIIGLALAATLGATALAADLQKSTFQTTKGEVLAILVDSGSDSVASVKIVKPGILSVEAGDIHTTSARDAFSTEFTETHRCSGGCKAVLSAEGKAILTLSGDTMYIHVLKARSEPKSQK